MITAESKDTLQVTPPFSLDAERAVVGSILQRHDVIDTIRAVIKPQDFYNEACRVLFETMINIRDAERPIDLGLLRDELRQQNNFVKVGGAAFLGKVIQSSAAPANAEHYAEKVRREAATTHSMNTTIDRARMENVSPKSKRSAMMQSKPPGVGRTATALTTRVLYEAKEHLMANGKRTAQAAQKRVLVRITRPKNRSFAIRYRCPKSNRDMRISVGSRNESEAESLKRQIEARLTIGLNPRPELVTGHPDMSWSEFRNEYTRLKLSTLRDSTASSTENRLDVCEAIVRPKRLADLANPQTLETLKEELLAGTASKRKQPRSPHTVNSYLAALTAALNWGHKKGWLEKRVPKQIVSADDPSKGRPLCIEEIERMLAACEVVCKRDPKSWKYLIRGLTESGLRVGEAMNLSFDIAGTIRVMTCRRGTVIEIPGRLQKNGKTQTLPITPGFYELLERHETQSGWVFNPTMRNGRDGRPTKEQVSRVIAKIGRKANISVNDHGKPASAHDLRRTFGQRLADAGVTPRDLRKIMRHQRIETTEQFYLRDDAYEIGDRVSAKLQAKAGCSELDSLSHHQIWHK